MTKFSNSDHYQTEYHGNLRKDEIDCFIELLENIEVKEVYGANNAMLKAKLESRLRDFEK